MFNPSTKSKIFECSSATLFQVMPIKFPQLHKRFTAIALFLGSVSGPLFAQNNPSSQSPIGLSTAFYGHYKGKLNVYKSANEIGMTANMEIIFGPLITTPPTEKNLNPRLRYPFIIKYDGDIRRYDLIADANNNFYFDENNGIHIDAAVFNNTLFSEFTVLNSTIYSSYKFFGDSIQFTLTSQRTRAKSQNKDTLHIVPRINPIDGKITGYDTTEIPAVESFPVQSYQCATLVRQTNAAPSQGRIDRLHYFPSSLITSRNVDVWLPSDYDPNKKYGVIYMHDGQNLFDGNSTWNHQEWGIDESIAAYNAIAQFNQKNHRDSGNSNLSPQTEYIVVGIWNDGVNRHSNYFPQKVYESLTVKEKAAIMEAKRQNQSDVFHNPINSDDYLKFIVYELRPFINKTYNTYTDPVHTVIGGSSMGGLISMYAICEYPGVFGTAACFSTHWPGIFDMKNNPIPDAMVRYFKKNLPYPINHKFLFTHGTEGLDALYGPTQKRIDQIMTKSGYQHSTVDAIKNSLPANWNTQVDQGLGHQESTWQKQFHDNVRFLLTPTPATKDPDMLNTNQ
jgi:predicted alpha/beta superfamily hydrolase